MAAQQVKYSYEAGDSGSAWFAIWHIGARVVRIYSPEGQERASIRTDGTRFTADQAAAMFGPGTSTVVQSVEQEKLYPDGYSANFHLEIDLDNDEVASLGVEEVLPMYLRQVAMKFTQLPVNSGTVLDINGNTIGQWTIN